MEMIRLKTTTHPFGKAYPATGPPGFSRRRALIGLLMLGAATLLATLGRMAMSFILPTQPVSSYYSVKFRARPRRNDMVFFQEESK